MVGTQFLVEWWLFAPYDSENIKYKKRSKSFTICYNHDRVFISNSVTA